MATAGDSWALLGGAKAVASASAAGRKRRIMKPGDGEQPGSSSPPTGSSSLYTLTRLELHPMLDSDEIISSSVSENEQLAASSTGGTRLPGGGFGTWKASSWPCPPPACFGTPGAASHPKGTLMFSGDDDDDDDDGLR